MADSILQISSLKLFYSSRQYGLKDDSKVLVLSEIDLYLLLPDDLVCYKGSVFLFRYDWSYEGARPLKFYGRNFWDHFLWARDSRPSSL